MSTCKDCYSEAAIECCSQLRCEQCIGAHLMIISANKHRPLSLNPNMHSGISTAIHNKLANEILELYEFKNYALQIINSFVQSIEKEVLEIAEYMSQVIYSQCDEIEQSLRLALASLMVKDSKDPVLQLFCNSRSSEDVKNTPLLAKTLKCSAFNITEQLKRSIIFSVSLSAPDLPVSEAASPSLPSPELDYPLLKLRLQSFPKPFVPTVFNFLPFTNKILFRPTTSTETFELLIDSYNFPIKASWSVSEGGSLMLTGGFDEHSRKEAFMYSVFEKSTQKVPKMAIARHNHSQIAIGNFVYVIGGVSVTPIKDCERFNLQKKEWSVFASLVVARECPATCNSNGKLYVAGGVGVESIECSFLNKPKFELLALRLPGPGKCLMFSYDDLIYFLHKSKVLTLALASPVLKQIGFVDESEIWSSCEPVVRVGDVSWVSNAEFYKFFMDTHEIKKVD